MRLWKYLGNIYTIYFQRHHFRCICPHNVVVENVGPIFRPTEICYLTVSQVLHCYLKCYYTVYVEESKTWKELK